MTIRINVLFLLSITLLLVGCNPSNQSASTASVKADYSIQGVSIVDMISGEVLPNRTILIKGEKISRIIEQEENFRQEGGVVVDGSGLYAIPGLWDMHDHLVKKEPLIPWDTHTPGSEDPIQKEIFIPLYVAFGVTGVRKMSGNALSLKIKARLESREWLGPDYVVGSPLLDGPNPLFPGIDVLALKSTEDARVQVRRLNSEGYDFLKPFSMLPAEFYRALTDEALSLGMDVAGELPLAISAWEAAKRGQRSIEHMTGFELACATNEEALRDEYRDLIDRIADGDDTVNGVVVWNRSEWEPIPFVDEQKCSELLRHLAKHDVWIVPTLLIQKRISRPDPRFEQDDPNLRYMKNLRGSHEDLVEEYDPDRKLLKTYDFRSQYIDDLVDAGVGVLAGTDENGGYPLHEEMALFVESGLSPLQALQTATINPARFLGREDELGSISKGKRADIILLSANPLQDIRNSQKIDHVFLKGVHFNRKYLDRLLEQTAADAASFPEWWAAQKSNSTEDTEKQ